MTTVWCKARAYGKYKLNIETRDEALPKVTAVIEKKIYMEWCKSERKSFNLVPEVIWHEMVLFPVATPMPRHRIHLQHAVYVLTNLAFIRYYFNFVHSVDGRHSLHRLHTNVLQCCTNISLQCDHPLQPFNNNSDRKKIEFRSNPSIFLHHLMPKKNDK